MSTNGRERLLDWDLDAPFIPAEDKQAQREEIARLTEEFLARGGEITVLPYDPTAEIVDRALNRQLLGFEVDDTGFDADDEDVEGEDLFDPYG
jgi:hypothetical protein